MYLQNHDATMQNRLESKDFDQRVSRAVQSFLFDLDFMLMEEQHTDSRKKFSFEKPVTTTDWLIPA